MFFKKKRGKEKLKKPGTTRKLSTDVQRRRAILERIDGNLAYNIMESIGLAYGVVKYGFGIEDDGSFFIAIYGESEGQLSNLIDEFEVDIDFSMSLNDILNVLTDTINSEMDKVLLKKMYSTTRFEEVN